MTITRRGKIVCGFLVAVIFAVLLWLPPGWWLADGSVQGNAYPTKMVAQWESLSDYQDHILSVPGAEDDEYLCNANVIWLGYWNGAAKFQPPAGVDVFYCYGEAR